MAQLRLKRGTRGRGPEDALDRAIDSGILVFEPNYVRRFYMDGARLGLSRKPGGTYLPKVRLWRPERWIASTVGATNPHPLKEEGLSRLRIPGAGIDLTFRRALEMRAERILGAEHFAVYRSGFPVLIKILDAAEPIIFHVHARDEDVRRQPQRFPGERFGKDEAYYFLTAPKGLVPYTHVGLNPGITRAMLTEAIQQGSELIGLSPVFYQRIGEGFYVPAGVPHRPGTALTLEIQQPSDVYTLLEPVSAGKRLSPDQMHPGFDSLEEALGLIDFNTSTDSSILMKYRLTPEPITETRTPEGQESWIFPPRLRRFTGKRLVVRRRFESVENGPYTVFVWRGRGRLSNMPTSGAEATQIERRLGPGTELLVTGDASRRPHLFESEDEPLEVFKLFPPDPGWWKGRGA
jgi:hypothetical protein